MVVKASESIFEMLSQLIFSTHPYLDVGKPPLRLRAPYIVNSFIIITKQPTAFFLKQKRENVAQSRNIFLNKSKKTVRWKLCLFQDYLYTVNPVIFART